MKTCFRSRAVLILALSAMVLISAASLLAQAQPGALTTVPRLVRFAGVARDLNGRPLTGVVGITFLLYADQTGGSPLWLETQNVQSDSTGHYSVLLGSTKPDGLPAEIFTSEQARWIGVQIEQQAEQPRALLVSAPYALKAGDAETLGGLPPSAFVLASPPSAISPAATSAANPAASVSGNAVPAASSDVTTTGGTVNALPLFTTTTNVQNSIVTQTGTTAVNVAGKLNLPATGTATASAGKNSQPEDFVASAFSSGTKAAVAQTFQLQAEPASNNTATPSGTLNLLYGSGTAAPAETGLKISNKGLLTFATGQTFPGTGTGNGTVTSVGLTAPASDFSVTGSPVTTKGTLNFAWTVAPTNSDTANAIVKRDATGSFNATNVNGSGTFTISTGNELAVLASTTVDGGVAIEGSATGSVNRSYGVEGINSGTAGGSSAVLGYDFNSSFGAYTIGVQGYTVNPIGIGVAGFAVGGPSSRFEDYTPAGVTGDGGTQGGAGVLGSADDGFAGYFINNSPSGRATLVASASNKDSFPFAAYGTGGYCNVDPTGDLSCTGSKNAVVPIDGGKRKVAMSAIESPVNWFEDAGSANLVNGAAVITLDADFIQTVNTEREYMVFPVPNGDCRGLYVSNQTATSFEVHELGGGSSNVHFYYRIMAVRRNYENVRFADHTNDPDPRKMMEQMKARRNNAQPQAHDLSRNAIGVPAKAAMLAAPKVETR